MTTPSSPNKISLTDINRELSNYPLSTKLNFNNAELRALAGVAPGSKIDLSDLHGKTQTDKAFIFEVEVPSAPNNKLIIDWQGPRNGAIQLSFTHGTETIAPVSVALGTPQTTVTLPDGTVTVKVSGASYGFKLTSMPADSITDVLQWGTAKFTDLTSAFAGKTFIVSFSAIDVPDLSQCTSLASMFSGCIRFNGNLGLWDVSNVENFSNMFTNCAVFENGQLVSGNATREGSIIFWDTRSATNMTEMFANCAKFNQPIGFWNTDNVTLMGRMFNNATVFNRDLRWWSVPTITSEPVGFASGAVLFSATNKPRWGTTTVPVEPLILEITPRDTVSTVVLPLSIGAASFLAIDWGVTTSEGLLQSAPYYGANSTVQKAYTKANVPDKFNIKIYGRPAVSSPNAAMLGFAPNTTATRYFSDIKQWGSMRFFRFGKGSRNGGTQLEQSTGGAFANSPDLRTITATDTPDILQADDLSGMFANCPNFDANLSSWNVSNVAELSYMFAGCTAFNNGGSAGIDNWNTEKIQNYEYMFHNARAFNQPLGSWKIGSTVVFPSTTPTPRNLRHMFDGATEFDQNIGDWTPAAVTDMSYMFSSEPGDPTNKFNNGGSNTISTWNVSNVENMSYMFQNAARFNQPLSNWRITKVMDTSYMFRNAALFNSDVGSWGSSTGAVTDMSFMFAGAARFNNNISTWNTTNVTNMSNMFNGATVFNSLNLGNWITKNVTNMDSMFRDARAFNRDLSGTQTAKGWCVTQFSGFEPANFSLGANAWTANFKPNFGTDFPSNPNTCNRTYIP